MAGWGWSLGTKLLWRRPWRVLWLQVTRSVSLGMKGTPPPPLRLFSMGTPMGLGSRSSEPGSSP